MTRDRPVGPMEKPASSRDISAASLPTRPLQSIGFVACASSVVAQVLLRVASQSATSAASTLGSCRMKRPRRAERRISIWLSMSAGSPRRCASAEAVPLRSTASLLATSREAEAR